MEILENAFRFIVNWEPLPCLIGMVIGLILFGVGMYRDWNRVLIALGLGFGLGGLLSLIVFGCLSISQVQAIP